MTGRQYLTYLAEIIGCGKDESKHRVDSVLGIVG
jgi:ABC-type multidrug transport system ATPase subunit